MSDPALNIFWIVTTSTITALTMVGTIVYILLAHSRMREKLQQEKLVLLTASERKYADLVNNVSDIMYLHSPGGIILQVNPSVTRLLGYEPRTLAGRSIAEILRPAQREDFHDYISLIAATPPAGEAVITGLLPLLSARDRSLQIFEYRSTLVAEQGQTIAVRGVARNVTDSIRSQRELRRAERRLKLLLGASRVMQENLARLSREFIRIQEEDRRVISRELHDEVGQLLAAITLNLEIMKNERGGTAAQHQDRLAETQRLVSDVFQRIHGFLHDLRPASLDEIGLLPTVELFTDEFSRRTGIAVELQADDAVTLLDTEQKLTIYRVIQECCTNTSRHSGADRITIGMHRTGGDFVMELSDNGSGFDPEEIAADASQPSARLGLLGMRERVRLAHGEFSIASSKEGGTRIAVLLPVPSSSHNVYRNELPWIPSES